MFVATDLDSKLVVVSRHDPAIDFDNDKTEVEKFAASARTPADEGRFLRFLEGKTPARWTLRTLKASVLARIQDGTHALSNLQGPQRGGRKGPVSLEAARLESRVYSGHLDAFRAAFVAVDGYRMPDGSAVPFEFEPTRDGQTLTRESLDRWFSGPMSAVALDIGAFVLSANALRETDRLG